MERYTSDKEVTLSPKPSPETPLSFEPIASQDALSGGHSWTWAGQLSPDKPRMSPAPPNTPGGEGNKLLEKESSQTARKQPEKKRHIVKLGVRQKKYKRIVITVEYEQEVQSYFIGWKISDGGGGGGCTVVVGGGTAHLNRTARRRC